jgi:hypothetical protein
MALIAGTNSYGDRAEADTYFADSLQNAAWSAFSDPAKDQALVEATRILERRTWLGTKEVAIQALAFPRLGLTDKYGAALTGAETLALIKIAQFEYALFLSLNPSLVTTNDATGSNVKRLKAGSAEIEYFRAKKGSRFPTAVNETVGCFLVSGAASGLGGAVTGNADASSFTNYDGNFGTVEGYP